MRTVVVTDPPRADVAEAETLGSHGVATVHEALGRAGYLVPVVLGGQTVHPGDVVLADDDGVMVVPRADVGPALTASQARLDKEAGARAAFQEGQLGLDRYGLRERLPEFGIEYVSYQEYREEAGGA